MFADIILFSDNEGNVIAEEKLPDWTMEYPYTGVVTFNDDMKFDAETMQLEVIPRIELTNFLPYTPLKFLFDIKYSKGNFQVVKYEVQSIYYTDDVTIYGK